MHIMRKQLKKFMALMLACSLSIPAVINNAEVSAAKAPKLSTSKITSLEVGARKKLTIKTNGVKKITKVTWKADKKNISLSNKSKKGVTVKGVSKGKATITATVKFKAKASSKAFLIRAFTLNALR